MNTKKVMSLDLTDQLTESIIAAWIRGQAEIGNERTADYARMIAKPQTKIYHSKLGLYKVIQTAKR